MNYCPYDSNVLEQNIYQGEMIYLCKNCGFQRELEPEETLLFTHKYNASSTLGYFNGRDIAKDKINTRVKIECSCGSKVGMISITGSECDVIVVCGHCYKNAIPLV